jgi:hypothetical protein
VTTSRATVRIWLRFFSASARMDCLDKWISDPYMWIGDPIVKADQ